MIEHYKIHGVLQFLRLYNIHKDVYLKAEDLHWGEEIEYHIYAMDQENRSCQLSCDANDILTQFNIKAELDLDNENEEKSDQSSPHLKPNFKLMPEFGDWMIEAVPDKPYGAY